MFVFTVQKQNIQIKYLADRASIFTRALPPNSNSNTFLGPLISTGPDHCTLNSLFIMKYPKTEQERMETGAA